MDTLKTAVWLLVAALSDKTCQGPQARTVIEIELETIQRALPVAKEAVKFVRDSLLKGEK